MFTTGKGASADMPKSRKLNIHPSGSLPQSYDHMVGRDLNLKLFFLKLSFHCRPANSPIYIDSKNPNTENDSIFILRLSRMEIDFFNATNT